MSSTPIGDHAFLSDRHSCALVDTRGSVNWLCFPRFDSPAVFGRLLDPEAGHWRLGPAGPAGVSRRYLPQGLVLETTYTTGTGVLVITDLLGLGVDNGGHRLGADVPHLLVRRVSCVSGTCAIELDYRPRPEYGLVKPLLTAVEGGVSARGGAERLVLTSPIPVEPAASRATGRREMSAGQTLFFALHHGTLERPAPRVWTQDELAGVVDRSVAAWQSWAEMHQAYVGPWADLVHLSGRVLHGLSFQPSGAIVAAGTTSLPERIGGERNWDYRYAWVRDASFTMEALWVAACPDEAEDYFSFMTAAAATGAGGEDTLQIVLGVGGEHDLSERVLPHLRGWRDSRPVRVGNDAWKQTQIDVYGELLAAAHRLADRLGSLDEQTAALLVRCADSATRRWRDKDHGIWEVRGQRRHFLHSKVMCWVAVDRAIALADLLGARDRVGDWARARAEIFAAVVREGWNAEANAFTQYAGSPHLDASALMMAIVGFLPADDPRMLATIDAIEAGLTDDRGLVHRYRTEDGVDGLPAGEGALLLCTFWLAHALALAGRVDRAREVFERAAAHVNDVGLLAEEVDQATGELVGNFPQAFSHVGMVNAAWAISQAEH